MKKELLATPFSFTLITVIPAKVGIYLMYDELLFFGGSTGLSAVSFLLVLAISRQFGSGPLHSLRITKIQIISFVMKMSKLSSSLTHVRDLVSFDGYGSKQLPIKKDVAPIPAAIPSIQLLQSSAIFVGPNILAHHKLQSSETFKGKFSVFVYLKHAT